MTHKIFSVPPGNHRFEGGGKTDYCPFCQKTVKTHTKKSFFGKIIVKCSECGSTIEKLAKD